MFSSYFLFVIVLKAIDAQMLLWAVFFKMHEKKVINFQKWPKWRFWRLITFFWCVFKNTKQNNNRVFIVFKAESEPKHEKKIVLGVFLQKPKTRFYGGKNKIVLKLKFQICISVFIFHCKRKLNTNFHKKILIFKPPGIF